MNDALLKRIAYLEGLLDDEGMWYGGKPEAAPCDHATDHPLQQAITAKALEILHQRLSFVGEITKAYGDSVRIRLPNSFVVKP